MIHNNNELYYNIIMSYLKIYETSNNYENNLKKIKLK